ncbi:I78 family peptidase inhibitor [Shinella oryzae]|uniref:I78 family peptidase inhibitor n=2 Tax=Shinella oryzae TaxID=2871820 RepID=A0ABY9KD52_9HYPH|nr:I78 family peptidase inhibitor [Shinella oryzae]WLS06427.1 I78 family peptidase inhibitor [Shinella oryzae]
MRLTGATIVRQIAPGQPVQQDYTSARVTIETDPSSGRIAHAACG